MKAWQMISIGALTTAILAYLGLPRGPQNVVELAAGSRLEPIAYGNASDPEIAGLLREYGDYLRAQGVNTAWFTPEELTLLRRYGKHAIPPRNLWDEMARTILAAAQPIRREFGAPLRYYNAYRPKWYNTEVGGAKNSLHIRNAALDILPANNTPGERKRLATIVARFAKKYGTEYRMGVGIYNYPRMTGAHVDALVRTRFTPYAATRKWMKAV